MKQLLETFTRLLKETYSKDITIPSIVFACIGKQYYCSFVRYREKYGEGKYVVCSAKDENIELCLIKLYDTWKEMKADEESNPSIIP